MVDTKQETSINPEKLKDNGVNKSDRSEIKSLKTYSFLAEKNITSVQGVINAQDNTRAVASSMYQQHFGDGKPGFSTQFCKELKTKVPNKGEQILVVAQIQDKISKNEGNQYKFRKRAMLSGVGIKTPQQNDLQSLQNLQDHFATKRPGNSLSN